MKTPKITALGVSTTAAVGVGAIAFSMSFTALTDLAAQNGVPASQAWGFPLIVDGLMLGATAATVAMKNKASRAYAYGALGLGSLLSVAGNAAHAIQNDFGPIGVGIAAIVPIILFIVTHLTVLLAREKFSAASVGSKPAEAAKVTLSESIAAEAPVEAPLSAEPVIAEAPVETLKKELVAVG